MKKIAKVKVNQELTLENGKKITVKDVSAKMGLIIGGQKNQESNEIIILHAWHFNGEHVDGVPGYALQF